MAFFFRFDSLAESRIAYYPVDENGQQAPHWQSELVIKDHLGNNRLFLCDKNGNGKIDLKGEVDTDPDYTEIIQESHYYAFGLAMEGPWNATQWEPSNAYRYNGKELNSDLGLDWYDYGARMYDAGIARWGAVDPLAEDSLQIDKSPYAYAWNNPVNLNDPDGRCPQCVAGFLIGFALDIASQMIFEGKSLEKVNLKSAFASGVAGAISGGVSTVAKLSKVGTVAVDAVIDAGESVAKQEIEKGSVDLGEVALDVTAGIVGSNVKVVDDAAIKVKERQLDRVERIAANDPKSTGRAENVRDARNSLESAHSLNAASSAATSTALSGGAKKIKNALPASSNKRSIPRAKFQMVEQDNTRVVVPIVSFQ